MKRWLFACALLALTCGRAAGDLVIYTVPATSITVVLEGKTSPVARVGDTPLILFKNASLGELKLEMDEISHQVKCPTTAELYGKMYNKSKKDATELMKTAEWALRRGLLPQFRDCVKLANELDPTNAEAKRLSELIKTIDGIDLGESSEQESILRNKIGALKNMEIRKSKHFILYHNTNKLNKEGKKPTTRKMDRAARRLDLLEKVYESFLFKFYSKGINLEIPKERLMVVLFDEEKQFRNYAEMLSPSLSMAAGFWSHGDNIAVFYDHGGTEEFKVLRRLNRALQEQKEEAFRLARSGRGGNNSDIVRRADALNALFKMWQENEDITVVSHECTHQMAGNTGLLPRHVMVPSWVHEGLATYFECPKDATWSGIGAVNEDRLEWYRGLVENQKEYSSLEWIVTDQIFDLTTNHAGKLHAYGQAWALTHFMLEQHTTEMLAFYDKLGKMPSDVVFSPESLNKTFDEVIKIDRDKLTREWRDYMDDLKSDIDVLMADYEGEDEDEE
ncbi:MAG: DUF1570 domain-containing protein [Planctomycetia bacterium]|nr:DUF1570 domain-containing protein [Planctomycetia bacterium]